MKKLFSLLTALCVSIVLFAADVTMYSVDFTNGQGSWTIDNKSLDEGLTYVWQQDATYGMKASAYNKANKAAESWLISPVIDLSSATKATLKVSHALNFLNGNANPLSVKISTDNGANWLDLALEMPAGTTWDFQDNSVSIDTYAGKNIKIAFVYVSTTTVAPTYEVKTLAITGDGQEEPETDVTEISIEEAIALCNKMEAGTYTDIVYCVKGVASYVYDYDEKYNNQTFYFGADVDAQKGSTLEVYRGVIDAPGVAKGDKIAVTGNLGVRTTSSGNASIGFKSGAKIEKIDDTAIDNAEVSAKAVKQYDAELGQVVIIRNGVKYNALGVEVGTIAE